MSDLQQLRVQVTERLSAAAEEIFRLVEKTIREYQEEASRSKEEIARMKKQIEQLTTLKPRVVLMKADDLPVSEDLNPSFQQCVIKVEPMPSLEEKENQDHPLIKEEQVDQSISPYVKADSSENAELRHPTLEPTPHNELSTYATAVTLSIIRDKEDKCNESDHLSLSQHCHSVEAVLKQEPSLREKSSLDVCGIDAECIEGIHTALPDLKIERLMDIEHYLASVIGVEKKEAYVNKEDLKHHLLPGQCCKGIQTFQQNAVKDRNILFNNLLSSTDTTCTHPQNPGPSPIRAHKSWTDKIEIPWEKMPASLLKAILRGTVAYPGDIRAMVRALVDAMQLHCPNPNKAACVEVAKLTVSKYPNTFTGSTEDEQKYGKSFMLFVDKINSRLQYAKLCVERESRWKFVKKNSETSNSFN